MIGENLRKYRQELNLSPTGLSILLNISRQSIYNWENGTCEPSEENIKALCDIFNISVEQLTGKNEQ